VLMMAFIVSS